MRQMSPQLNKISMKSGKESLNITKEEHSASKKQHSPQITKKSGKIGKIIGTTQDDIIPEVGTTRIELRKQQRKITKRLK